MNRYMRACRVVVAVILALIWAPLTAHCQLETVVGLNFLQCPSAGDCTTEGNSHCDDSSCCGWEAGLYKLPHNESSALAPLIAVSAGAVGNSFTGVLVTFPTELSIAATAAPPELLKSWRFFLRAALPVRAPSFTS